MEPSRSGPFPYVPINRRKKLVWPGGARLALWVIPNIEIFPLDEPVPGGTGMAPDIINWAPRDYGARVGVFRIMEVLERHGVRGTVALNSEVCDDHPRSSRTPGRWAGSSWGTTRAIRATSTTWSRRPSATP